MQHLRAHSLRLRASFAPVVAVAALSPARAFPCDASAPTSGGDYLAATPAISVGTWHTCAVGTDGVARCWGSNTEGQLGNGTLKSSSIAVRVPLERVVDIAAGYTHTCALDARGAVWCWGENRDGQLGDSTWQDRPEPALVRGLSDVIGIASGAHRSCALRADGTVFCWGNGILGALGDGRNHTSSLPVPVTGITDAMAIAVGEDHACAVHASGRVSCWGRNTWGQLGDGSKDDSNVPRAVMATTATPSGWVTKALEGAVAVGAGYAHTCVLRVDGKVSCWGAGWYGQLGDGSTSDTSSPVVVSQLSPVKAISVGGLNSCAVLADGTARCWGSNAYGQIGDGTTRHARSPVEPRLGSGEGAPPLSGLVAIRTGDHTCAIDASSVLRCWGANYTGQLGDGTHQDRTAPGAPTELSR